MCAFESDAGSRVVAGSSFDAMRAAAVRAEERSSDAALMGRADGNAEAVQVPGGRGGRRLADHLRRGKAGEWRRHFEPFPEVRDSFQQVTREWQAGFERI